MAKIVATDIEQSISPSYSLRKTALVGIILGIFYWIFVGFIERFIGSVNISGNITTILIGVLGIAVMVKFNMVQPLIISIASGISLWGLGLWTSGLGWGETIIWDILLYCLVYILFSWIARYARVVPAIISMVIIILILRIVISL